jgi:lanosterol synthase
VICVDDDVADFENSMISYPNYKFIFPIKALGMYAKRFGDEKIL